MPIMIDTMRRNSARLERDSTTSASWLEDAGIPDGNLREADTSELRGKPSSLPLLLATFSTPLSIRLECLGHAEPSD